MTAPQYRIEMEPSEIIEFCARAELLSNNLALATSKLQLNGNMFRLEAQALVRIAGDMAVQLHGKIQHSLQAAESEAR